MYHIKQMLFDSLKSYFTNEKLNTEIEGEKEKLELIAKHNMCISFLSEAFTRNGIIPSSEAKSFLYQAFMHNYKNLQVQSKIIRILTENNIPCVVIKGASISVTYPEPMTRILGDIDLLVAEDDYEKTVDILLGGADKDKLSLKHKFHYRFVCDGIIVEIHRAVDEFSEEEKEIEEYMKKALINISNKIIEGNTFPAMREDFQAISLLKHTKAHYFENMLSMKMLCDWAMYINSIPEEDWIKSVYPLLEKFSLDKWADSLSCVCEKYLGIELENKIRSRISDETAEQLAEMFISERLEKNNVDIGESKKKNSIKDIFTFVNGVAARDFKAARFKILLPLFWGIIGVRYILRMKTGSRGKINISTYASTKKAKEILYKEIIE